MKEITWYGRGGQGAFTASRILGAAAMLKGYNSLAFPSFGPERRGAPIRAFTKISEDRIADRSIIKKNDYIIVLDDSLYSDSLIGSLKDTGYLLINTKKDGSEFRDPRILTQDISTDAEDILGRPIVNIGILGLLLQVEEDISLEDVAESIRGYMPQKLVDKNIKLLNKVYEVSRGKKNDHSVA